MGLAGPKRRSKLSHDPNNTQWSKCSDSYGQKILSAQGWTPAANASHIRILLREENLGLGAQVGKGNAETFALSLYSGVLSRLNGKSDAEVQRQQNALRSAELRNYQAQKFGSLHFVSGGFLVGDTIQSDERQPTDSRVLVDDAERRQQAHRSKKARRQEKMEKQLAKSRSSSNSEAERHLKRTKIHHDEDIANGQHSDGSLTAITTMADRKPEIDQSTSAGNRAGDAVLLPAKGSKKRDEGASGSQQHLDADSTTDRPCSKEDKRARKEERRRRKMLKAHLESEQKTLTELPTQAINPANAGNRHGVRRRYIDQKRMALDAQAMKEIFMVTTKA